MRPLKPGRTTLENRAEITETSIDIWNRLISNQIIVVLLTMEWGTEGRAGPAARRFAGGLLFSFTPSKEEPDHVENE